MTRKKKIALLTLIFLLTIGYAVVNTSVDLNSLISLGYDVEDFKVYISKVKLDDVNISESSIEDSGTVFSFMATNDTNTLTYRVTNESTMYDANIELTCDHSEDVSIEQITFIEAQSNETATININASESELITCVLSIDAVSRTEKKEVYNLNANEVEFTPEDPNWNVQTVEEALNYLRNQS